MADEVKAKKRVSGSEKTTDKRQAKHSGNQQSSPGEPVSRNKGPEPGSDQVKRKESLHRMLLAKRQEIMSQLEHVLGRSLTEEQHRRLESAMDVGDQAIVDLERELGISLLEMQNRKRQLIDEALRRLQEGTYGICAECGVEISERRLAAVPFAKLCVKCQSCQELLEKIEREEERD